MNFAAPMKQHYSEAANWFDKAPPLGWICANCGETTDAAGGFRAAKNYETDLADDDGEIYECSTCGSSMVLPPPALAQTIDEEGDK